MVELRFIDWDRPFLPDVARWLADWKGNGPEIDLVDLVLVCPGARAGRRLLELLIEEADTRNSYLLPPRRITTVGSLPEVLYEPERPVASGLVTRQAWLKALSMASRATRRQALGIHAERAELEALGGYAHLLDSLSRTVGRAGLSFSDVAQECRTGFLFSDEARWTSLDRIQVAMRGLLTDSGLQDREGARARALSGEPVDSGVDLVLVGVAESPLITRKILAWHSGRVTAFVHAPEEEAHLFDELGMVKPDAWKDRPIPLDKGELRVCDRPSDQAAEVKRIVGSLKPPPREDQMVIGVPDPGLVPYLVKGLEGMGLRARYAEGPPTRVSAPAQLLRAMSDYLSSRRFSALARLLRHPDLPEALHPASSPEWADEFFSRRFPDTIASQDLVGSAEPERLGQILHVLEGPELLGKLEGSAACSAWMPRILECLAEIYRNRPIPSEPALAKLITEPLIQIRNLAEEVGALPESLDEKVTAAEAIRVLLRELQEARIPPDPDDSAVELIGWLELQLDDAPLVIVTGISDPFLPESLNADPFLPNALRRRLGIEDNDSRYARDAYRLTALLRSAVRVVLIAGGRSAAGDPLRPSRLLLTEGDQDLAKRVLQLTGESGEGRDLSRPGPEDRPEDEGPLFTLPPEANLPLLPLRQPFPVTGFRQLLQDPYLWVLETVRRIEAMDDEAQELDPAGFGILAHGVLDGFARSVDVRSTSATTIKKRLDAILDEKVRRTYASRPLPTVALQVEQLRTRLGAFADFQAAWAKEGWEIRHSEARTPEEGVPLDVDGEPVRLSGRIDRIDHNPLTGEWILIDYKTGDHGAELKHVRTREGAWKDLQLPLYRFLLPFLTTDDGLLDPSPKPKDTIKVAYLPLPRAQKEIAPLIPDWTDADFDSALEAAREALRYLFRQKYIRFDPLTSGRNARGGMATLLGKGLLQDVEAESS